MVLDGQIWHSGISVTTRTSGSYRLETPRVSVIRRLNGGLVLRLAKCRRWGWESQGFEAASLHSGNTLHPCDMPQLMSSQFRSVR